MKIIRCDGWLRKPNPAFEGRTPLEIIEGGGSSGAYRVAHELERLELEMEKRIRGALSKPARATSPKQFDETMASIAGRKLLSSNAPTGAKVVEKARKRSRKNRKLCTQN